MKKQLIKLLKEFKKDKLSLDETVEQVIHLTSTKQKIERQGKFKQLTLVFE